MNDVSSNQLRLVALTPASHVIDSTLLKDGTKSTLFEVITNNSYGADYTEDNSMFIEKGKAISIPESILSYYNALLSKSFMGIFPEIKRVWITIDNKIFLWNYLDGTEYKLYDGLDQIVVSIGLVKPRPNVFHSDIRYLLVVSTPVEIFLLAVRVLADVNAPNGGDISIHPTQISVSTDNVNMIKIVGTDEGRIFMCGADGNLYELFYHQRLFFGFGSENYKKNWTASWGNSFNFWSSSKEPLYTASVDNERKILYTATQSGTLILYDLGQNGDSFSLVHEMTENDFRSSIELKCNNQIRILPERFRVGSIIPISTTESNEIHVLVITSQGFRIYFSTNVKNNSYLSPPPLNLNTPIINTAPTHVIPNTPYTIKPNIQRPVRLEIVHVSPKFIDKEIRESSKSSPQPKDAINHPLNINAVFYSRNVTLMTQDGDEERDSLITICLDPNFASKVVLNQQNRSVLPEFCSNLLLDGKIWSLEEDLIVELPFYHPYHINVNLSELATQHYTSPRRFLCLTTSGLHVFTKQKPVDQLAGILLRSHGLNSSPKTTDIQRFTNNYSDSEVCSMLLALACEAPSPLAGYATVSFFKHDNHAEKIDPFKTTPLIGYPNSPAIVTPNNRIDLGMNVFEEPEVINNSYLYIGFLLYLSRLLKPVWEAPVLHDPNEPYFVDKMITDRMVDVNPPRVYEVGIPHLILQRVVAKLRNLKAFLDKNPMFAPILTNNSSDESQSNTPIQFRVNNMITRRKEDDIKRIQNKTLSELHIILLRAIEALELLHIVGPSISRIFELLSIDNRTQLLSKKFKDIVVNESGISTAREIAMAFMKIEPNQMDSLGVRCPCYFSLADRSRIQAQELVEKANAAATPEIATELLNSAYHLFVSVLYTLTPDMIADICSTFVKHNFFGGAVGLIVKYLSLLNHQEAEESYKAGQLHNEVYQKYEAVLSNLRGVLNSSLESNNSNFRAVVLGSSKDSLYHMFIFQWYLEYGLQKELWSVVESPYLESFLLNNAPQLLWLYLNHRQRPLEAALVLTDLAERSQTLNERVENFSQARVLASSFQPSTTEESDAINDIIDRADVALLQQRILNALKKIDPQSKSPEIQRAISDLESRLFNISELYNQFTSKFNLPDFSLLIIHISQHHDPPRVKNLWNEIITSEFSRPAIDLRYMCERISTLGKELYPNNDVFPVSQIIEDLEKMNFTKRVWEESLPRNQHAMPVTGEDIVDQARGWIVRMMAQDVGIPYIELYTIYKQILASNDPNWKKKQGRAHIIEVIQFLINEWAITGGIGTNRGKIVMRYDFRLFENQHIDVDLERFKDEIDGLDQESQMLWRKLDRLKKQLFPRTI